MDYQGVWLIFIKFQVEFTTQVLVSKFFCVGKKRHTPNFYSSRRSLWSCASRKRKRQRQSGLNFKDTHLKILWNLFWKSNKTKPPREDVYRNKGGSTQKLCRTNRNVLRFANRLSHLLFFVNFCLNLVRASDIARQWRTDFIKIYNSYTSKSSNNSGDTAVLA